MPSTEPATTDPEALSAGWLRWWYWRLGDALIRRKYLAIPRSLSLAASVMIAGAACSAGATNHESAVSHQVAWVDTQTQQVHFIRAEGQPTKTVAVPMMKQTYVHISTTGRYLLISGGEETATGYESHAWRYDEISGTLTSLPCGTNVAVDCDQLDWDGDTLSAFSHCQNVGFYTMAPTATTFSFAPVPNPPPNPASSDCSVPTLSLPGFLTPDGYVESVPSDSAGEGPWTEYLLRPHTAPKLLTTVENLGVNAFLSGSPGPTPGTAILDEYIYTNISGETFWLLNLTSGKLAQITFPTPPSGDIWTRYPSTEHGSPMREWFIPQPISCQEAKTLICGSPTPHEYELDGTTWKPTGRTGKSLIESDDGNILETGLDGPSTNYVLMYYGRVVSRHADAVTWT